jgi:hypothetical protein
MTPLLRFFEARLPGWLVWPAMALSYAAMLTAVLMLSPRDEQQPIIYIDVHG